MLLKSSIITSDTKEKSLQYLSNKSYTISLISLTHYKLNFFTQFYPKMV